MRTVYYCLNGVGYFGSRSLRSAIELTPLLHTLDPPTYLRLFCVADPKEERQVSVKEALRTLDINPRAVKLRNNLEEILSDIRLEINRGVAGNDVFLIHDCSPTSLHWGNVVWLNNELDGSPTLRNRIRYLVEKPALTSVDFREWRDWVPDFRPQGHFFCDYIELQSQTYLAAKEWLYEHADFRPTHLFVWRNSGTGFKKVFERARAGVTGGALEDKAAHDIAVTLGLLGSPVSRPTVTSAIIENYLIGGQWLGTEYNQRPSFATVEDSVVQVLDRRYSDSGQPTEHYLAFDIADARIAAEVSWPLKDRLVHCRYSFSWDGVEPELREQLGSLKFPEGVRWIGAERRDSFNAPEEYEEYTVEEARIYILEDRSNAQPRRLILNFLTKFDETKAWIAHSANNGSPITLPVPECFGGDNSLVRVLLSVIQESESLFGWEPTLLISKLIYEIRSKATAVLAPDDERRVMNSTIERFVDRSHRRNLPRRAGVIFDLDNTLFRTSDIPQTFVDPIIEAITSLRPNIQRPWIEEFRAALFRSAFDVVRERFGLSREEYKAAFDVYLKLEIPAEIELQLFPDASDILQVLLQEGIPRALLTRGFRNLQKSKINRLSLNRFFSEEMIFVDAVEDASTRPGQVAYLRRIAEVWKSLPQRIMVVGDDPHAELKAALELGMEAVLVLRDRDIEVDAPYRIVRDLSEVKELLL